MPGGETGNRGYRNRGFYAREREGAGGPYSEYGRRGLRKKELEEKIYPCMLSKGEYFSFGFQPSLCAKLFRRALLLLWQGTVDERIRLGRGCSLFFRVF